MPKACANGGIIECDCATSSIGPLNVLPDTGIAATVGPVAAITAINPANINFGLCEAGLNPVVLLGAPKGPCTIVPTGPWITGSTKVITKQGPLLTDDSKLFCAYGGQLTIKLAAPNITSN